MTQEDVASQLFISRQVISKWETRKKSSRSNQFISLKQSI
ncbi:hypothetical protein [Bacillus sp. S10(2024)]